MRKISQSRLQADPDVNDPYRPYLTRLGNLDQRTHGRLERDQYPDRREHAHVGHRLARVHPASAQFARQSASREISSNAFDIKVDQYSQEVRLASPKDQSSNGRSASMACARRICPISHDDYGYRAAQWFSNNINADPALLNGVSAAYGRQGAHDQLRGLRSGDLAYRRAMGADRRVCATLMRSETARISAGIKRRSYTISQLAAVVRPPKGATYLRHGRTKGKRNNSLSGLVQSVLSIQ